VKWKDVLREMDTFGWRDYFSAKEAHFKIKFNWTTDGCSNAPDSLLVIDLTDPCGLHDFLYRNHIALNKIGIPVTRRRADACLRKGIIRKVKEALGFPGMLTATVYWLGVRLGGGGAWRRSSGGS